MKIIIESKTISELVKAYLSSTITVKEGAEVEVSFAGNDAIVEIIAKPTTTGDVKKDPVQEKVNAAATKNQAESVDEKEEAPTKKESLKNNPLFKSGEDDEVVEEEVSEEAPKTETPKKGFAFKNLKNINNK